MHVFSFRTMDTMDKFEISANPFDHILAIMRCDNGVWISVKGSSVIELWDYQQLNCKMLYDIKENKHPTLRKVWSAYYLSTFYTANTSNRNIFVSGYVCVKTLKW